MYPIGLVHCGRLLYLVGSHDERATKRFGWPLNRFTEIEILDEKNPLMSEKVEDHLAHLFVHGVLHLLGYRHASSPDSKEMELMEIKILSELGIGNPY